MKTIKSILALSIISVALISCADEKKTQAEKAVNNYVAYVDSVNNVALSDLNENWNNVENGYTSRKIEVESILEDYQNRAELDAKIEASAIKYEQFKANYAIEYEKEKAAKLRMALRNSLFNAKEIGDDLSFAWVNKDNILSTYDNFVNTVSKNKNSYSREDWDEIKMLYEALDTQKNKVEKEGLSSSDNLKIAGLKVKFAPMYTFNRMGAKAEENAAAKE